MGRNQRKWRNILLDRNFQLSFTVLLVGLAALLMTLLGLWVKDVAKESTQVGQNHLEPLCADIEDAVNNPAMPATKPLPPLPPATNGATTDEPTDGDEADEADEATDDAGDDEADDDNAKSAGAGDDDTRERPRATVIIEDTHMEIAPRRAVTKPAPNPTIIADLERCRARKAERVAALWSSYRLILIVLFAASFFLILGLAIHGLRMTHKVAGPLFKVGLYLEKLGRGTYDQVWDLRKGDQLMEFYEHFRAAHRELTHMQADDIAVLEKFLEAADAADLAAKSPELKSSLGELRELLAGKREGLKVPEDKRG